MRYYLVLMALMCYASHAGAQHRKHKNDNSQNDSTVIIRDTPPAAIPPPDTTSQKAGGTSAMNHQASPDSLIRIGLILPFDAQVSTDRLRAAMSDDDKARSEATQLRESSHDAIDFYEGLQFALSTDSTHQKIAFYVFDSQNNDSIVEEQLKSADMKNCDIIIGPTNAVQAKAVSAFCKANRIINIQPFVASRSFATENPYLVRFMPTIDAHLQKEYEMVVDSFSEDNIIIYTTKKERDLSAARYLDTLFSSYNAINEHKLKYTLVNGTDSTLPLAQRTLSTYIRPGQRNIIMMTCYDEPIVNSQLRTMKENMVVFGMPTWIDDEQVRADYLNKAQPYFTDNFYVDTAQSRVTDFITSYTAANGQPPTRYSYLGYDAMRYLSNIFHKYGKAFKLGFDNESYDGLGFSFHLSPVIRMSKETRQPVIGYYANTAMHIFQVSDYKVWLVR